MLAAKLMEFSCKPKGTIVIVNIGTEHENIHHTREREEGFKTYFYNNTPDMPLQVLNISSENINNRDSLLEIPDTDISGIFATSSAHIIASYLNHKGKDQITLIGYDLTNDNINYERVFDLEDYREADYVLYRNNQMTYSTEKRVPKDHIPFDSDTLEHLESLIKVTEFHSGNNIMTT